MTALMTLRERAVRVMSNMLAAELAGIAQLRRHFEKFNHPANRAHDQTARNKGGLMYLQILKPTLRFASAYHMFVYPK